MSRALCMACGQELSTALPARPMARCVVEGAVLEWVGCEQCGVVQRYPAETTAAGQGEYGADYYVFAEEEPQRWARAVQQYIIHILPWESGHYRRLLEVGCATGHLTALAAARGWRVVGLDVSAEAVSQAVRRFQLDYRAGTLERHAAALPPFDLVFMGDVLEHVPQPAALLGAARRVLSPGGLVCLDTPNWASPWRRWGGEHWLGLNRFHQSFYDAASASGLLANAGFEAITTGDYTHYRYESWAVRPEVQAWVTRLHRWLAWRINRYFDRRAARSPWAELRRQPPVTLAEAGERVERLAEAFAKGPKPRRPGDNLTVGARRPA